MKAITLNPKNLNVEQCQYVASEYAHLLTEENNCVYIYMSKNVQNSVLCPVFNFLSISPSLIKLSKFHSFTHILKFSTSSIFDKKLLFMKLNHLMCSSPKQGILLCDEFHFVEC
ncbi:hypothetical protein TPENAI_70031 [Tenacibaculum litopenaei]